MQKLKFVKILIATGFFTGHMPLAPATFACVISALIWYFLLPYKVIYLLLFIALFIWGIIISDKLCAEWGRDPHRIVVDEYASFLLPLYFTPKKLIPFVAAFLLFRFFDIVKPFPIRRIEKLPGGWGIMLDDLAAAVFTAVIILIARTILHW